MGVTSRGLAVKELLTNSYKFRMTYAFASNDLTQDIVADPVVTFQTVQTSVELRDSQNQLMDEGSVKYYSGGWRDCVEPRSFGKQRRGGSGRRYGGKSMMKSRKRGR